MSTSQVLVASYDDFLLLQMSGDLSDPATTIAMAKAVHHGNHYTEHGRFLNREKVGYSGTQQVFVGPGDRAGAGDLIQGWGVAFDPFLDTTLNGCLVGPGRNWGLISPGPHTLDTIGSAREIWVTLDHTADLVTMLFSWQQDTTSSFLMRNIDHDTGGMWEGPDMPYEGAGIGPLMMLGSDSFNILYLDSDNRIYAFRQPGDFSYWYTDSEGLDLGLTVLDVSNRGPESVFASDEYLILHSGGLRTLNDTVSWTASDLGSGGLTPDLTGGLTTASMFVVDDWIAVIAARAVETGQDCIFRFDTQFGVALPPRVISSGADTHGIFSSTYVFHGVGCQPRNPGTASFASSMSPVAIPLEDVGHAYVGVVAVGATERVPFCPTDVPLSGAGSEVKSHPLRRPRTSG